MIQSLPYVAHHLLELRLGVALVYKRVQKLILKLVFGLELLFARANQGLQLVCSAVGLDHVVRFGRRD